MIGGPSTRNAAAIFEKIPSMDLKEVVRTDVPS